jgi:hypothetical protein
MTGDRRLCGELVEDDVRRVCRDGGEVDTRAREAVQRGEQILDERWPIVLDEREGTLHVETVDDDGGRRCWLASRPPLVDAAIVVDGGLGTEPAYEAECSHQRAPIIPRLPHASNGAGDTASCSATPVLSATRAVSTRTLKPSEVLCTT